MKTLLAAAIVLGLAAGAADAAQVRVGVAVGEPIAGLAPLDSRFAGFSYEKSQMSSPFFSASNKSLIALFGRLGPGVLRIGANAVDRTAWTPAGAGLTKGSVSRVDVDRLAGFLRATGWRIIYGLGFANNTPGGAADEAAYAAKAFGPLLYGFEFGNEPDLYRRNGLRPATYDYPAFKSEWERYYSAVRAAVPRAAVTGPASAYDVHGFTERFSEDEKSKIALLTHHYYRANGQLPSSTIDLLLSPDPKLEGLLSALEAGSKSLAGGYRLAEANSFYNGGAPGVSNGFGTALWAVDFLFENALQRCSGVNFHGGGDGPGYTPIADDRKGAVDGVRPVYYGMLLFDLAARGSLLRARVEPEVAGFSAYAVRDAGGRVSIVLNNKDRSRAVSATIHLGAQARAAKSVVLSAPSLESTRSYVLGAAPIGADGGWRGKFSPVSLSDPQTVTVAVPAGSAELVQAH